MLVFVVIDLEGDILMYLLVCLEFILIFGVLMFISDYDVDVGFVIIVFCGVMVFDGSLIDMVIFVVNINNINDNILIFFRSIYLFYVIYDFIVGIVIVDIFVIDGDKGIFGNN